MSYLRSRMGGSPAWASISGKPSVFAPDTHAHSIGDVSGLSLALDGKQAAGSYASASHSHAATEITEDSTHRFATDTEKSTWNGKQDAFTTGFGLTGTTTKAVALTTSQAFATAETTISAATYADITGCSITLAAGTWVIFAHVIARQPNAIFQAFVAITDSANTVIAESAVSRPASGTASLNSPTSCNFQAIVTPSGSTTYKLRAARGLTTHTGSYVVMDGNGVNTSNHASNNSDKGTNIMAIRIA